MGEYLRNAYALKAINDAIDADRKELSDKLESLTLSHNRKKKALRIIRDLLETTIWSCGNIQIKSVTLSVGEIKKLIKFCDDALFCDGRERSKR